MSGSIAMPCKTVQRGKKTQFSANSWCGFLLNVSHVSIPEGKWNPGFIFSGLKSLNYQWNEKCAEPMIKFKLTGITVEEV
jgi:hypothetical protein